MEEKRSIEIVAPTSRAWEGMKRILFRPFDISKWFVLGFSAWLASLMDGRGSNFNFSNSGSGGGDSDDIDPGEMANEAMDWIKEHLEMIITVGAIVAVFVVAVWVALLWVSSRGKFMLVDNVVHNRALVAEPWKGFRTEGNSLFRWRVLFVLVSIAMLLAIVGGGIWTGVSEYNKTESISGGTIAMIAGLVLVLLLLVLFMNYVQFLQETVVVPVMYARSLRVSDAWKETLRIHGENFGSFVLFFLWQVVLGFGAGAAMLIAMLVTCCIAAILFAIPYIGAVALLPVTVFFRILSLEFIRQFGKDFDVWKGATLLPALPQPRSPFEPPDLPPKQSL